MRKKEKSLVQRCLFIYIFHNSGDLRLRRWSMRDMIQLHVWKDSFMCDMSAVSMCDRTHSFVCSSARRSWDSFAWHSSFIRVTWLGGCPSCWVGAHHPLSSVIKLGTCHTEKKEESGEGLGATSFVPFSVQISSEIRRRYRVRGYFVANWHPKRNRIPKSPERDIVAVLISMFLRISKDREESTIFFTTCCILEDVLLTVITN